MSRLSYQNLPSIPHAGYLGEQHQRPAYLGLPGHAEQAQIWPFYSGGVSGQIQVEHQELKSEAWSFAPGKYQLRCYFLGQLVEQVARLRSDGQIETRSKGLSAAPGQAFLAELEQGDQSWTVLLREQTTEARPEGYLQVFEIYRTLLQRADRSIQTDSPHQGLTQLRVNMGEQRAIYPLQLSPSVLDVTGRRLPLHYAEAIERFADLALAHRPPYGRTLVYMDGNADYFAQFALQEVGRLLGVRNLYGSNIWGSQALAQSAELQRGQEAPFVSIHDALNGPSRLYLLNGWNGFVTHPLLFERLQQQPELQVWLIDTVVSESAKVLASQLGPERIILLKPGTESHLALALAHTIFENYPQAINSHFIDSFAQRQNFEEFATLARSEIFAPEQVAELIVADPVYLPRLQQAMAQIAEQLVAADTVPIHLPGTGLLQSGGQAAVCLWNNLLAMLGKFGFSPQGELRGGELRLLDSQNEGSQLLGLSPDRFFGNLPLNAQGCQEAAERMGLPAQAYDALLAEAVHPILTFPESSQAVQQELIICIGNGMEARWMRDVELWQRRLRQVDTTLVVIDPMPGPLFLKYAALCLTPTPPIASHRLVLNGEWRLTHNPPRRQAPPETRTEATILYDLMAEVSRSLREEPDFRQGHPDLAELVTSGYLQQRFEDPEWGWGGKLRRLNGEVSRAQLWQRVQNYLGGEQPLYCRPESEAGEALSWEQSLESGSRLLNPRRLVLSRDSEVGPFQNLHRQRVPFHFFVPTERDFAVPNSQILNLGSSIPDASHGLVRYAIASSAANTLLEHPHMPLTSPLYLSPALAQELGVSTGDRVQISGHDGEDPLSCEVQVSQDIKGQMVYLHHYPTRQEVANQTSFPWMRFPVAVCPYSQVPLLKKLPIHITKDNSADA